MRTISPKSRPRSSQCPSRISLLCAKPSADAVEVGVVGVLRGDPQGHLLAAAGDPHGDAVGLRARRRGALQRPRGSSARRRPGSACRRGSPSPWSTSGGRSDALVERAEPLAGRGEAVAVGAPLVLVPAGADAHLDAAAGDDVDGRGDLREVGGVAVGHARAHLAEAHPARWRRANAAIRVHASCVASCGAPARCGSGRRPRSTPSPGSRRRAGETDHRAPVLAGSMPTRSIRQPWGTKIPNLMRPATHLFVRRGPRTLAPSCDADAMSHATTTTPTSSATCSRPRRPGRWSACRATTRPHGVRRRAVAQGRARQADRPGAPERRDVHGEQGYATLADIPDGHRRQGGRLLRQLRPGGAVVDEAIAQRDRLPSGRLAAARRRRRGGCRAGPRGRAGRRDGHLPRIEWRR